MIIGLVSCINVIDLKIIIEVIIILFIFIIKNIESLRIRNFEKFNKVYLESDF